MKSRRQAFGTNPKDLDRFFPLGQPPSFALRRAALALDLLVTHDQKLRHCVVGITHMGSRHCRNLRS
jgi:hypothetical protein